MMPKSGPQSQIMYSSGYSWSAGDLLGKGAFGQVFKGYDRNGRAVAIKTFDPTRSGRKQEVDVLKKIRHKNVVRLYTTDTFQGGTIMVMELCNAGNLHNMLDDPENNYGFEEDDFKVMLAHITAGMKHLHANEIVHRDLKPGNIMKTIKEDGEIIYKLTDFGAARELKDTEQFSSLCGTQEYLHPDMYAAFLKRPTTGRFNASIDLWSLGVTLYHLATGALPFRPYGGARRNNEGMIQIIQEKPSDAISGVQSSSNSEIVWAHDLPKTCRFCQSFREEIVPIIRGILEQNPHRIWTFDRYFKEVENLLNKSVVYTFSMSSSSYHPVYISQDKCLKALKDKTESLLGIPKESQIFVWDGYAFERSMTSLIRDLPTTTPLQPIVIVSSDLKHQTTIAIPHTCKPPKVKLSNSFDNDAGLAKICSSTLYNIQKTVKNLLHTERLIRLAVKWFISYLKNRVFQIKIGFLDLTNNFNHLKTTLSDFEEHYRRESSILNTSYIGSSLEVNGLTSYFSDIQTKIKELREVEKLYNEIKSNFEKVDKAVLQDDTPKCVFVDGGSLNSDRLEERIVSLSKRCREIIDVFRKHKQLHKSRSMRPLSSHEENYHKCEKSRLNDICEAAVKLFTNESVPACKRLHKESQSWFCDVNQYYIQLEEIRKTMPDVSDMCVESSNQLRTIQRSYRERHERVAVMLRRANGEKCPPSILTTPGLVPASASFPINDFVNDEGDDEMQSESIMVIEPSPSFNSTQQMTQLMQEIDQAHTSIREVHTELDNSDYSLRQLEHFTRLSSN